ncbi:MAG: hypothetical protein H6Q10_927 [Acidobacteria bacterium]|nr:hypothetical protein [Acidobacteriota bacterium]
MTGGSRALSLLGSIAVAAGGWVASGILAQRPPSAPPQERPPVSDSEVARESRRLSLGLRGLASPPARRPYAGPVRNPFQFADTGTVPAGRDVRPAPAAARAGAAGDRDPDARPTMQLAGMAEDPGPDGPVRRAVVKAGGELFVVGRGDVILGRFRVARLDAEAVELEDLEGGPAVILALR